MTASNTMYPAHRSISPSMKADIEKIISFHGPGTILPGYHTTSFRIELSLSTAALSDIKVLEFTIPQFKAMFESNTSLAENVVNWYSKYVNRFLFETIQSEIQSITGETLQPSISANHKSTI